MTSVSSLPKAYDGVALVAPVSFGYARYSDHGADWFLGSVLREMLAATGLKKEDVDGICAASFSLAPDTAVSLPLRFGMEPRYLDDIPMGGASGVVAARRAARAVQNGDAEVVACLAGDTNVKGGFADMVADFSRFSRDAVYPYGAAGPNASFALVTQHYMNETGTTREDFGRMCVTQRGNAQGVAHALMNGKPLTLDAYMAARPIAPPVHMFDCVMPCAGGDGFLVMSEDRAKSLGVPYALLKGAVETYNAYHADPVQMRGGWAKERETLWAMAGLEPADMDIVQTYDDYPVICLQQLEGLGFCAPGQAAAFLRENDLSRQSPGLVHNCSGGQLSVGQAGAAGGFLGLVEALRQVTGQAQGWQIDGARRAVVAGYGMILYDRCQCANALVLETGAMA